jgi:predicted nucleic-acid-binding Zn-ribbon protein
VRKTLICPKCDGRTILHVTQIADSIGQGMGGGIDEGLEPGVVGANARPMRLARLVNPKNPDASAWSFQAQAAAAGLLEAYVCRACGYTEWYTRDPQSIPADGQIVVERTGPPKEGTFR